MDKKLVLRRFADDVINLLGTSLVKIILYGSYARGDFHENSDMDVMILTSLDDDGIRKIENSVYDIASDYELSENVHISVINILCAGKFFGSRRLLYEESFQGFY